MVAGGRGGKEAREMYLIQFPGDEEDEGEMVDDEEGEGSLSVEGEETANIKEEVRETGFLRGRGVGGESGTASLTAQQLHNEKERRQKKRELTQKDGVLLVFSRHITAEISYIKGRLLI